MSFRYGNNDHQLNFFEKNKRNGFYLALTVYDHAYPDREIRGEFLNIPSFETKIDVLITVRQISMWSKDKKDFLDENFNTWIKLLRIMNFGTMKLWRYSYGEWDRNAVIDLDNLEDRIEYLLQ